MTPTLVGRVSAGFASTALLFVLMQLLGGVLATGVLRLLRRQVDHPIQEPAHD